MRPRKDGGLLLAARLLTSVLAGLAPGPGRADPKLTGRVTDVPDELRQAVIYHLQHDFVYPDLVVWDFQFIQPYITGGIAICGQLNLADSTRRYVGMQPFYAIYVSGNVTSAGIVAKRQNEDPVLSNRAAFKIACGQQ